MLDATSSNSAVRGLPTCVWSQAATQTKATDKSACVLELQAAAISQRRRFQQRTHDCGSLQCPQADVKNKKLANKPDRSILRGLTAACGRLPGHDLREWLVGNESAHGGSSKIDRAESKHLENTLAVLANQIQVSAWSVVKNVLAKPEDVQKHLGVVPEIRHAVNVREAAD